MGFHKCVNSDTLDGLICVGGPLHHARVKNKGKWFQLGKDGDLEYFNSTICSSEFSGKYLSSCVCCSQNSNNSTTVYLWECDSKYLAEFANRV
ncbi:hypothetical protein EC844_12551 [Acinetobacter calcoaceticus]|uniref:Uncharacterized protein n=1 Tax=Acinetobacter calcoaceticus TaxID=471 RepID=A0A4R1XRM3_ACICA|nr:hypothetical protein EC844_12551 [Acinetobacter calcoaceticus]